MKTDIVSELKNLRRCDTPLVFVRTADPSALRMDASVKINGNAPQVGWDMVRGLYGVNQEGNAVAAEMTPKGDPEFGGGLDPAAMTRNPVEAMALLEKAPEKTLVWWMNPQRMMDNPQFIQAMANLRDSFRGTKRTWVGLGPDITLPPEVQFDVVVVNEELPVMAILEKTATELAEAASVKLAKGAATKAASAVRGVSAFMAEQLLAVSMTPSGFDLGALAERRKAAIEQTPGLKMDMSGFKLEDIGGLAEAKRLAEREARAGISVIVVIDEIEKAMAKGDLSGVSTDQLNVLLTTMENKEWTGPIAVGPPGCLSGETPVTVRRGKRNSGRTYTLAQLHGLFNGGLNHNRRWDQRISTNILSLKGETIMYRAIADVVASGVKETFTVQVHGRKSFRATADHRFLTPDGYKPLSALRPGDEVIVRGQSGETGRKITHMRRGAQARYHPRGYQKLVSWEGRPEGRLYPTIPYAWAVYEADMNGLPVDEFLRIVNGDKRKSSSLNYLPDGWAVHHKDEDPTNDVLSNLEAMSKTDHDRFHGMKNVRNFGTFTAVKARIVKIKKHAEEPTYDITMADAEAPNFLVSGVVVHNSGKTMVARALGSIAQCPTLTLDMGACKGSLVGESERKIRAVIRTVEGLAGDGQVYVVATCNGIDQLPPELIRRFKVGVYYFDIPDLEESKSIWKLSMARYGITGKIPPSQDWTGAEIRNCCQNAARWKVTLDDAAQCVIPYAKSQKAKLVAMRQAAAGNWLSASYPGAYRLPTSDVGIKSRVIEKQEAN